MFYFRNFLTLQQSPVTKQWQEKPLCLGTSGSCRGYFPGHVLGFGEDELGTISTTALSSSFTPCLENFVLPSRKMVSSYICWKCTHSKGDLPESYDGAVRPSFPSPSPRIFIPGLYFGNIKVIKQKKWAKTRKNLSSKGRMSPYLLTLFTAHYDGPFISDGKTIPLVRVSLIYFRRVDSDTTLPSVLLTYLFCPLENKICAR